MTTRTLVFDATPPPDPEEVIYGDWAPPPGPRRCASCARVLVVGPDGQPFPCRRCPPDPVEPAAPSADAYGFGIEVGP